MLPLVKAGSKAALGNREVELTELFRGSKSRNKVSVGEPVEGSLSNPSHCLYLGMVKHRVLVTGDGSGMEVRGLMSSKMFIINSCDISSKD